MLKHRQDGLVGLHGTILLFLVTTAFLGFLVLVETQGWIEFTTGVNWRLYLVGVLSAMAWIHYSLRGAAERLGALSWLEALRLTAQQLTRLMVVLFTLTFVTKDVDVSRAFLIGFVVLAGTILLVANLCLPSFLANAFFHRQRLRTVVVASSLESRRMQAWLAPRGYLGFEPIGYVTPEGEGDEGDPMRLGTVAQLRGILLEHGVDQVVFAHSDFDRQTRSDIIRCVEQARCRIRLFVNMNSLFGAQPTAIEHNENYAFAASTAEPLDNPLNRVLKRTLDIVVALPIVLFVLPPLTVLVWIVQRIQSPGPVFYQQMRSGLNRQRFSIYKFRTMHVYGDKTRAKQATVGDARVYPFGRFLRRSSLDELPQFINVIFGSMSVSGPRPHLLEHDEEFSKLVNAYYKRHFVKPGITGLAQSKGFRGEVVESSHLTDRVHYDMLYVANWSFALDVSILVNTVRQIVKPPRSAY
jgi:exopolysaccharide biosynthesis polyprenyl glycosylphosphotransferase